MVWWEALLLIVGGFAAGVINSMAGGGSVLTVPLLVLAGVPGNNANASNRVGILASSVSAATAFRRLGVQGLAHIRPVLAPTVIGSLVGSYTITRLSDDAFEQAFGLIMIPVIVLSVRRPKINPDARPWSTTTTMIVFFFVGLYGGAFQAGVGLVMIAALVRSGLDLVTANHVKVIVNIALTLVALPVFIVQGKVEWIPALLLAVGLTSGAWAGAHIAVRGGEKVVRIAMVIAAVLLSGRLLGVYG